MAYNGFAIDEYLDAAAITKQLDELTKWAKILIITMSVLFLIAGSFLGGYVFGKYLENNHKEQTYFEPEPMQQQTPTIQIEDSTSQNEE